MKVLIAGLLLLPCIAFAESWSMKNKNGGEIVITDRECRHNGKTYSLLRQAYSYWNGGLLEGCWTIQDNVVKIIWNVTGGAETRVYEFGDFSKKSD
jgi:hypothetical protein